MKKSIFLTLIILLVGIFAFAAWNVLDIWLEYRAGERYYEDLEQYISTPESDAEPFWIRKNAQIEEALPEEPEPILWPQVDFAALREVNPDVVGWIYIPNTNVNYPILQGKTNDQYIYRLMTGEYNSSGSIFMEAGIGWDFSEQNTPIYGHNMKNGTMFADITGYKSQEFYDAHPFAMLLTPEKNYYVRIFSGYVTDIWGNAWDTAFSEERFGNWLESLGRKSYFSSAVVPTTEDRILTFSTCTYETDEARFVVHGVLEEYTEEIETAAE